MIVIYAIIMISLLAFYAFLINKTMKDDRNQTCDSSWWLRVLAVINFVWWSVIFIGFAAGMIGIGKCHPNWYLKFIDYNLVDNYM